MGEESGQKRAAALLRDYLETRDIPCEACGYNLRGAQDVFCPECGAVIPRPPAEHMARARTPVAELKLWCWDCGYTLTGVDTEICPECGGRTLQRYTGKAPPRRPRVRGVPRCLPLLLTANTAIGLTMALMGLSISWQRWFGAGRISGNAAAAFVGAILCSAPLVVAWLWVRNWPRLRLMEHGPRRLISSAGFIVGLGLIAMGLSAMG